MSRLVRSLLAAALAFALGSIHAAAPTYSIDAHVLATGTSAHSRASCFRMQATIGEAVAGFSSSTTYALSAGYRTPARSAAALADDIFFDGFEDCTP